MNKRLNKLMLAMMATGLVGSLVVGCGSGGSPELSIETPVVAPITAKYKYAFTFVNASDNTPITDELTVTFMGDSVDGGEVVDQDNVSVKGKTYTVKNGVLLAAANFDLSTAKDVFTVIAGNRTAGWNESGQQMAKSTSAEGDQVVTIKLTNTKPAAVEAVNKDSTLGLAMKVTEIAKTTGGEIVTTSQVVAVADKDVTTVDGDTKPVGVASVTFPASVKPKDETGAVVNVTNGVTVSVTKYSADESRALAAFPGGFTPSVNVPTTAPTGTIPAGTTADTGGFISGGFAQFNVTDNATGKALKTFDKPLTLKIDLPKGSLDADGNAINTTDNNKYPIWSFDQASGKWVYETDGEVKEKTPADPNNFEVEFKSNHLSYWNLDFYGSTCTGNLAVRRTPAGDTRPLTVEIVGTVGQRFYRSFTITDSQLTLARYPVGTKVNVTVKNNKGRVLATQRNLNLCSTGQAVAVTLPTVTLAPLTVNVTESCRDGTSGKRASPTTVYFYDNGARTWKSGYTSNVNNVATITFNGIEAGTTGTLYVRNRFSGNYDVTNNVAVSAPSAVKNVNYASLACTTGGQPI